MARMPRHNGRIANTSRSSAIDERLRDQPLNKKRLGHNNDKLQLLAGGIGQTPQKKHSNKLEWFAVRIPPKHRLKLVSDLGSCLIDNGELTLVGGNPKKTVWRKNKSNGELENINFIDECVLKFSDIILYSKDEDVELVNSSSKIGRAHV